MLLNNLKKLSKLWHKLNEKILSNKLKKIINVFTLCYKLKEKLLLNKLKKIIKKYLNCVVN